MRSDVFPLHGIMGTGILRPEKLCAEIPVALKYAIFHNFILKSEREIMLKHIQRFSILWNTDSFIGFRKPTERIDMMKEKFLKWLKAAGIRAARTMAQTAIATIGVSAFLSEVNWGLVASSAMLAGILSLLSSVSGLPELK